jgi:Predicted membrane protein (DUF2207)
MRRRFLSGLLLVTFALCAVASAQERILSFDSEITVNTDGSMLVHESIRVNAQGQKILHGIYRDFPTDYKDRLGLRKRVPFEVTAVQRDGQPESYHTSSRGNGVRVYMGPRFSNVPPGEHTYEIVYRTDRQLGFYDDRDELYWNVTGNGWDFPIEHASALVNLPSLIPRKKTETYAFTGPQGYTGRDFSAKLLPNDNYFFETTKRLDVHEGMTIVCWWDKGYLQPPTEDQRRQWFVEDNQGVIVALGGLALVLIYQFMAWFRVGRDPAPGTIVPQYMPPDEISAAGMRELVKMSFDNKAFAASVVSMAAKKYVTITKDALDAFTLTKSDDPKAYNALSAEEKLVASRLFARGDKVLLSQMNRDVISEAVKALKQSLSTRMEKIYFVRNGGYVAPSVVLSLATLLLSVWLSDSQLKPVALFMLVWLTGWSFGVAALSATVINLWKTALRGGSNGALKGGGALAMTLFAIPFFGGEILGITMLARGSSVLTVIVFALLVASNFVFHELLKAPTHMGRVLLDKVQGFKQFLVATEADQIKRMAPVVWNVDTFNRFLPYAIALDVEQEWASKFSGAITAASATAAAGTSMAYSGAIASSVIAGGFASSLGDSLSGAISSASVAPGSSSGSGGGGSSGGGGGGGGGGGW